MKIAIYAIAKNEEKHIERFMRSCADADAVVVGDTGSTDKTVDKLLFGEGSGQVFCYRCSVYSLAIHPWRFDDARNAVLALVPSDVDWCISLDLDEVLVEGWREKFEKLVEANPTATKVRYGYVWNWKSEGVPGVQFRIDKAHKRFGFRWRHPVHETIEGPTVHAEYEGVMIEHHADTSKSRGGYLQLLEQAVKEDPSNERMRLYLKREQIYDEWSRYPGGRSSSHHRFGRYACDLGYVVEGLAELERALTMTKSITEKTAIEFDIKRYRALSAQRGWLCES